MPHKARSGRRVPAVWLLAIMTTHTVRAEQSELQVALTTPVLAYTSTTTRLGTDTSIEEGAWASGVGPGVLGDAGYGLTPNVVLGGMLGLSRVSRDVTNVEQPRDNKETSFFLGPKLEYMFPAGYRTQPFFGVALGVYHASQEGGEVADRLYDSSVSGYQCLARVGARFFVVNEFSVDPALAFGYVSASGSGTVRGIVFPHLDTDVDYSGYQVGLMIGISGWID